MKSLRYLNKYFIKYKWRMLLGIIFIIASNFFDAQMPLFVKNTVDGLKDFNHKMDFYDILIISLKIGGIYMLLSIGKGFFQFLTRQSLIITSRLIEFDLKNEIYAQYQKLDYNFYKKNSTGDLMNRISEDVSQVRQYLGPGIMYTVNLVIMFAIFLTAMLKESVYLTLFVLAPLPIMSLIIYKVSTKMNLLSKEVQKEQSTLSTIIQENFSGIRVIKAYNQENSGSSKLAESANEFKKKNMKLVMVNALFMPTIMFLIGLSTLLSIYIGGKLAIVGDISIGTILAFILFVGKLTWPFASIGWVTSINQRAAASQTRINEFLQTEPAIKNPTITPFNFGGKIEFKNVSYTYENSGIPAISNLSFTIEKGETFAVVGKTGSGKSTVLNLLTRQFDPTEGEIYIDGINLKDLNLVDYRKQIGVVPQDVFLFSDTIGNNIQFGLLDREASKEELIDVTKQVHVWHNIEEFKDQFDTLLGERGVNLSGGQKQRISIARALIGKPKLLLLDDCLSAVDTETEDIILKNLKENKDISSTLIVSHRISSIRNAKKIIVIENGTKIEEGSHNELIELNQIYAEMYKKQLIEEEKEN